MTTDLITKALDNVYYSQRPDNELIFHSDLGTQYTSDAFFKCIEKYDIAHYFSHRGSPYDNACTKSFHAILKKEEVNHVQYLDYHSAKMAMF